MDNTGRMSGTINKQWFLYQEKEVFQDKRQKKLILGIPNELEKGENLICLTPESVHILVSMGHEVLIQRGAGNNAYYGDTEYADAGAMIVETLGEVYTADVVLKATSVSAGDTVYMHDRQVILSPLKLCDMRKDAITEMMQKKVTAVGFDILKSLRIRSRGINFIACPTCSRQEFDVIGTVNALEQRLEDIITPMDVSIIGCVVNGPGEALVSTLGVTGGNKKSGLYEDGVRKDRLDNNDMIDQLEARIRAKASQLDEARRIDVQQVEK